MRTVAVLWRPRQITDERALALRDVLEARPGDDEVIVVAYDHRVRLPAKIDGRARDLRRAVYAATGGDDGGAATIVIDDEEDPL